MRTCLKENWCWTLYENLQLVQVAMNAPGEQHHHRHHLRRQNLRFSSKKSWRLEKNKKNRIIDFLVHNIAPCFLYKLSHLGPAV